MDNPEKLATYDTPDQDNKNKYTTPYGLETTISKQTQITLIRHNPSYKKPEVKTNCTSLVHVTNVLMKHTTSMF